MMVVNYAAAPQEQIYFVLKSRNYLLSQITDLSNLRNVLDDVSLRTKGHFIPTSANA